jgi:CHAT domain-containing protein
VKEASTSGELARHRFVHFAVHGLLGPDAGRQPCLALGLGGPGREDGRLRLDEVSELRLNADLVVLSACESGLGRLHEGEGIRGLAQAFLRAGSRGIVCSVWRVADAPTAPLMVEFYAGLKAGKSAADALRSAQKRSIEAGEPPLYWAPFILIGE